MEKFEGMASLTDAMSDEHAAAKALANFMFRQIVEDIHAEGKITNEEMKRLNKEAVNRAALLMDDIFQNRDTKMAFLIEAAGCGHWDPPESNEYLDDVREKLHRIGSELRDIREEEARMKKIKKQEKGAKQHKD